MSEKKRGTLNPGPEAGPRSFKQASVICKRASKGGREIGNDVREAAGARGKQEPLGAPEKRSDMV